jgi:hypothetical protein
MKQFILIAAVSYACQAAIVVAIGNGGTLASQVRLAAAFYGLEVKEVDVTNVRALKLLADPETIAVVASPEAVSQVGRDAVLAALRRSTGANVPVLLVDSGSHAGSLAEWTGNRISGCTALEGRVEDLALQIPGSALAGPLAGIELPFHGNIPCTLTGTVGADDQVLEKVNTGTTVLPVFMVANVAGQQVYVAAATDSKAATQRKLAEIFAGMSPVMMFLHHAAGERGWHTPAQYANLTVDDPWLREPYGNLDYAALADQMRVHNFHTTIAFVPWNFDRSEPRVVALFRANPERFSIAIHGNNHDHREFDEYGKAPMARQTTDLKQALARMESFTRHTGIPYEPVMVFPHAVSPAGTLSRLKEFNYWGTVNSENVPLGSAEPIDPIFPLRPETLSFNNFLSVKRVSAEVPVSKNNLAINAFLGNPLLLYVHQEFFRGGADVFNPLADYINKIAPATRWKSLGQIVQHLYLERRRADGDYDVQAFAPSFTLSNPSNRKIVFHVRKAENFEPPLKALQVDGAPQAYEKGEEEISFEINVLAGKNKSILLTYANDLNLASIDVSKQDRRVSATRLLSDVRDNVLSTNAVGQVLIRLYLKLGSASLFLMMALPAAILALWGIRRRKLREASV